MAVNSDTPVTIFPGGSYPAAYYSTGAAGRPGLRVPMPTRGR